MSCTAAEPIASWPASVAAWPGYFNLDAMLIRVLFVVLTVLGGSGLAIYLALWIIVPNELQGAA